MCMSLISSVCATDIGVYYFPGWHSKSSYWQDLKGGADSRSPNLAWPEREPLLGFYAEEDIKVAEQHIEWASQYGVTFFAYDWYWSGNATYLNHAIDNFLRASNNKKLKFSLLWANHSEVPKNLKEFDGMVDYWVGHYFHHTQFYKIDGKPVVFVFSNEQLSAQAKKIGQTTRMLFDRANERVRSAGLPGLYFVTTTNTLPSDVLEDELISNGYSAYTGWNYVISKDKAREADYLSMVDTYLDFYKFAQKTRGRLPYMVPVSPGWDSRPWGGPNPIVRYDSTPQKFQQMLVGARKLLDSKQPGSEKILMIEAWNEFGEGAYIEPTKKWKFQYLERIQSIFSGRESGQ